MDLPRRPTPALTNQIHDIDKKKITQNEPKPRLGYHSSPSNYRLQLHTLANIFVKRSIYSVCLVKVAIYIE